MSDPALPPASELEAALRRHVLDVWFPRCIDREHGGFLCDFDRRWRACGPHDKLLEFQGRQTLFLAEAALALPADAWLREAALHGFACLRDVMWDGEHGGWFHRCDRSGRPLHDGIKHVHGVAYAMQACATLHRLTADAATLDLARRAFEWLEATAHDAAHGGYHQFFTRRGVVIDGSDPRAWSQSTDTIGTAVGLKDTNTHSDLLEALTVLYEVWPDPRVRRRLAEIVDLFTSRILARNGGQHHFFAPDWTTVPHLVRFGTAMQTAARLPAAAAALGGHAIADATAVRVLEHVLRYGRDARTGAIRIAGPAAEPLTLAGSTMLVRAHPWWVQLEALRALHFHYRRSGRWLDELAMLWCYIRRRIFDERHGGVYTSSIDSLPWWRPRWPLPPGITRKGDVWKDASHEGRVLLMLLTARR